MKKVFGIIILICIINSKSFSQKENDILLNQKDSALPMRKVHVKNVKSSELSKQQKKLVKKYKKSNKAKKIIIKKNTALTEQQRKAKIKELNNEKHNKLEAILTPEQKEKMKQMKENKPRRGVTNMPNERRLK